MEPCSTAEFPEHHSRNCLCWELRGTSLARNQLRLQHQHSSPALDACSRLAPHSLTHPVTTR
jgi:hypothetical protein